MSKTKSEQSWTRTIGELAVIALIVIAAKTAIAEPFYVPSSSMEPTLLIGDELLATKFAYGYGAASLPAPITIPATGRILGALPRRGDIVVFRAPLDRSQVWVKRVIGLPGDRIAIHDAVVSINGERAVLKDDGIGEAETDAGLHVQAQRFVETLPGGRRHLIFKETRGVFDNMAEKIVPPGHLFVMGDNRDNSADSRFSVREGGVGMLPAENLVGRVDALVGSWDLAMAEKPLWTWPAGLRFSRFFSAVH